MTWGGKFRKQGGDKQKKITPSKMEERKKRGWPHEAPLTTPEGIRQKGGIEQEVGGPKSVQGMHFLSLLPQKKKKRGMSMLLRRLKRGGKK